MDAVDSTHHLSLSFQWWFQVLRWLYFYSRLMDQPWHNVFDNSMRRPWPCFCYRFDVSVVNSFTMSVPYVSCHSVFRDNFLVYNDSGFADYLWISGDITFFTFPCVSHESIFANYLMCRSWIHLRCWFHTSAVTQFSVTISRSTRLSFLWRFMNQ